MSFRELYSYLESVLNLKLFTLQDTPVTVLSLVIFIVLLSVTIYLSRLVKKVIHRFLRKSTDIDDGLKFTLSRISQYIIVLIGTLISFQVLGINLTSLAFLFGLLSVGIGFGLQNITANFISGLIIMFERPISVGDRVEVDGKEGDVTEINIRSTKIKTLDNISIIVPNSQFVENDVVNFSHGDPSFRLEVSVGVSYDSDLDTVLKALNEVAEEHPKVMKTPPHSVHLVNFGDSAWDMKLFVWVPDVRERYKMRNELNQAIVRKFDAFGIEIPYPQRDLHVRSGLGGVQGLQGFGGVSGSGSKSSGAVSKVSGSGSGFSGSGGVSGTTNPSKTDGS